MGVFKGAARLKTHSVLRGHHSVFYNFDVEIMFTKEPPKADIQPPPKYQQAPLDTEVTGGWMKRTTSIRNQK